MEKQKKSINVCTLAKPFGAFCHATIWPEKEKDLIFVSGMTARGVDGEVIGNDIETQTRQCLENLKSVLIECGANMDDVMRVTVYTLNMEGLSVIHRVRSEFWPNPDRYPASTLVAVNEFVKKDFLIEIEAIAIKVNE